MTINQVLARSKLLRSNWLLSIIVPETRNNNNFNRSPHRESPDRQSLLIKMDSILRPSGGFNLLQHPNQGEGGGLRSLVKLPRLAQRKSYLEQSPKIFSAGLFNPSPLFYSRDISPSPHNNEKVKKLKKN